MSFERILPSEVARLVYGYLFVEYEAASHLFLRNSPLLRECYDIFQSGDTFGTKFYGLSLLDILKDYCCSQSLVDKTVRQVTNNPEYLKILNYGKLYEKIEILAKSSQAFGEKPSGNVCTCRHNNSISRAKSTPEVERNRLQSPAISQTRNSYRNPNDSYGVPSDEKEISLLSDTPSTPMSRNSSTSHDRGKQKRDRRPRSDERAPRSDIRTPKSDVSATRSDERGPMSDVRPPRSRAKRDRTHSRSSKERLPKMAAVVDQGTVTMAPVSVSETREPSGSRLSNPFEKISTEATSIPSPRSGVEKEAFLNSINLEKEYGEQPSAKLTRSRSCSDIFSESSSERRKLRNRPRFFTPNKWNSEELSTEALKATLQDMYKDSELHEKLARSINHAMEEVSPAAEQIDLAIQSIIEKTQMDPAFEEVMNSTLSTFDLHTYLKPAAKPLTSVTERLRGGAKRSSSADAGLELTIEDTTQPSDVPAIQISELLPYPNIHYEAVDCNIVTGGLDADGNCTFMSHPGLARNNALQLPPVTAVENGHRYRNILPKIGTFSVPNVPPVIVCTPMMPPPPAPAAPTAKKTVERKKDPGRLTRAKKATMDAKSKKSNDPPPERTPLHTYTDDMPVINFFATPADSTKSPAPAPAQATPAPPPPVSRRKSSSTPRRKSHIRALEFATPEKGLLESPSKKSLTSPKMQASASKRSPIQKSVQNVVKANLPFEDVVEVPVEVPMERPVEVPVEKDPTPPIATRTPMKKPLSGAWDNLTGMSCVLGTDSDQSVSKVADSFSESTIVCDTKDVTVIQKATSVGGNPKSWDADLRLHVSEAEAEQREAPKTTKRTRRVKRAPRNRKVKKKASPASPKKTQRRKTVVTRTRSKTVMVSPSKLSATSKRCTFSVSGSSGTLDSSAAEELLKTVDAPNNVENRVDTVEMTPLKTEAPQSALEETPFSKLFRENVQTVDIDLSMISTPYFPETPCIELPPNLITPIHETRPTDYSSSSSYYKPELTSPICCSKNPGIAAETIEELQRSEEHLNDVTTLSGRNILQSPEPCDIQPKPKEQPEPPPMAEPSTSQQIQQIFSQAKQIASTVRASGKNMSFCKLQMLAQCDLELCQNIVEKEHIKTDFREELEAKRKTTAEKLKKSEPTAKRKKKVLQRPEKRVKVSPKPAPSEFSPPVVCSTPNKCISPHKNNVSNQMRGAFKKEFPAFEDDGEFPELSIMTKQKLFVVKTILQRPEVEEYLKNFTVAQPPKIVLLPAVQKLVKTMFKWLKHPHKTELETCPALGDRIFNYLECFRKINCGLPHKRREGDSLDLSTTSVEEIPSQAEAPPRKRNSSGSSGKRDGGRKSGARLPLKKRKNATAAVTKQDNELLKPEGEAAGGSVVSPQLLLQRIDVDRFLSHVHGQENA